MQNVHTAYGKNEFLENSVFSLLVFVLLLIRNCVVCVEK